ncbi:MAG: Gfo/Idh/MocA family oxidoreductase [Pirellulaceae bacterium]|nr:Gfo/Idh/MocA family oxidoreductase [Pirellulaceae bacterium]
MSKITSRRDFIGGSTAAVAGALMVHHSSSARAGNSPNDKIQLGLIGCGNIMRHHVQRLNQHADRVVVTYLCDPDQRHTDSLAGALGSVGGSKVPRTLDYQNVLDDKQVDAVLIGTPHHWHVPIALPALQAGKDVYLEKPASHVFREGRLLIDAVEKYGRVFQHGTQMRSSPVSQEARKVLESGILGEIKITKAWNVQNRGYAQPVPDSKAPAGVDYDRWLGPAPSRPFNENRFHRNWRLFRDYGNGDFGDDGAHDVDMAAFGLGVDSLPVRITAHGSNVMEPGYREFPDNMNVSFEYADGRVLIYEDRLFTPYGMHGYDSGNAFYGTKGYMIFTRRGTFRTYVGGEEGPAFGKAGRVGAPISDHMANWLDCIRSREKTRVHEQIAHNTVGLIHLGEIAYRTKTVLEFDTENERITNSDEANAMLTKDYREPYGLPESV